MNNAEITKLAEEIKKLHEDWYASDAEFEHIKSGLQVIYMINN